MRVIPYRLSQEGLAENLQKWSVKSNITKTKRLAFEITQHITIVAERFALGLGGLIFVNHSHNKPKDIKGQ